MNEKTLLRKLDEWHVENKFDNIINTILKIPEEDRDYSIISHLARAYNNISSYENAIEQLLLVKDKGEKDPLYHYKLGFAYYYLDKYENALNSFKLAYELCKSDQGKTSKEIYPGNRHQEIYQETYEDILFFLEDTKLKIYQKKYFVNEIVN